jgi:hypothetical protein
MGLLSQDMKYFFQGMACKIMDLLLKVKPLSPFDSVLSPDLTRKGITRAGSESKELDISLNIL